jgi:hypothetical protein
MLKTNSSTCIMFQSTIKINPFSKILCPGVLNVTSDKSP